jgi:heme A synthase
MKSKACALIAISVLVVFMAWQCFTWPVVEMGERWVRNEREAELALNASVERPPTAGEMAARSAACTASLLLGAALVWVLRSRKAG